MGTLATTGSGGAATDAGAASSASSVDPPAPGSISTKDKALQVFFQQHSPLPFATCTDISRDKIN